MPHWIEWGILLYVICLPLRQLPGVPWSHPKFHLTELIFLLFAPACLWVARRNFITRRYTPYASFLIYLGALSLSTVIAREWGGFTELAGRFYLLVVGLIMAWYVRCKGFPGLHRLLRAYQTGIWLLGISAVLGLILLLFGRPTVLVNYYENFPYFGSLYRVIGTSRGATPFALLSIPAAAYAWHVWRHKGPFPWLIVLFLPLWVLSFSKEVILVVPALVLVEPTVRRRPALIVAGVAVITALYLFSTHFIVQRVQEVAGTVLAREEYTSGRVVGRAGGLQMLETTYTSLKRAAWIMFRENWLLGVGADQFHERLPELAARGLYPAHLPDYNPHSTWFGALAQSGLVGFFGLLSFAVILYRRLANLGKNLSADDPMWIVLGGLLAWLIASLSFDLLHLRFVWVYIGLTVGALLLKRPPAHA